jgi:class 3 adenylate cyclase
LSAERVKRRLAGILAADVAGYSRLMGEDEAGTLARLKALRRELIDPEVAGHKGRIVKTTGDGLLIEFPSVVEAVACALSVQQGMAQHNADIAQDQRIEFRIGINSGDVIVEDGDIHGDGVNIAARLEGLAEPGGICVSAMVHDQVQGRLDCAFVADRFDGSLEDVFELQDQIAISVAGVIEPALQAAEMRRSAARPTTDLTAYDLYLRALAVFFPLAKERLFTALELFDRAIALDRHYGPALSWAAICHLQFVLGGWAADPEKNRRMATDFARQALQVGENDPGILVNAAFVLANFGEDIGAMIGLFDRALGLNPNYARGWYLSGMIRVMAGQHDLAIEHMETSLRLSPRERMGMLLSNFGMAHFFKRQFDEAASKLLLAIQDHPGSTGAYRTLAACYAQMGRLEEARAIVARLRAVTPQIVPSVLPVRNPEDRELYLSGLRMAMGESE